MPVYDGSFSIFKGKSVARFTVIDPEVENDKVKTGCVLLEVAPSVSERKYDWEKKQTFGLTPMECTTLAKNARNFAGDGFGSIAFFHDPDASSTKPVDKANVKKLSFTKSSKEGNETTFIGIKDISVPLSPDEVYHLAIMLEKAAPFIMGWPKF